MLAAVVLLLATWYVGPAERGAAAQPADGAAAAVDTLLVRGGTIILPGQAPERADLVLASSPDGWVVQGREPAGRGALLAPDTLDATGLFLHSADAFNLQNLARVGRAPWIVVRTGPSPGSPALWLLGPIQVRAVSPEENHPPGPVDDRVGCYTMERGPWDNERLAAGLGSVWVPDDLRLHWQYGWHHGRETLLVATDLLGRIHGERTAYAAWAPLPADSLRVGFGTAFAVAMLRLGRVGDGWSGQAVLVGDAVDLSRPREEQRATAPVRLVRVACP